MYNTGPRARDADNPHAEDGSAPNRGRARDSILDASETKPTTTNNNDNDSTISF